MPLCASPKGGFHGGSLLVQGRARPDPWPPPLQSPLPLRLGSHAQKLAVVLCPAELGAGTSPSLCLVSVCPRAGQPEKAPGRASTLWVSPISQICLKTGTGRTLGLPQVPPGHLPPTRFYPNLFPPKKEAEDKRAPGLGAKSTVLRWRLARPSSRHVHVRVHPDISAEESAGPPPGTEPGALVTLHGRTCPETGPEQESRVLEVAGMRVLNGKLRTVANKHLHPKDWWPFFLVSTLFPSDNLVFLRS